MLLQKSTPILVITVLANWGIAKDYEWTNSIGGTSGDVAVESAIDASTCNNYTWSANGNNYTSSGIYTATLTANQNGASYQWIDCISNTPISGATDQQYTATQNVEYQVQITLNGCTDSSSCIVVNVADIKELGDQNSVNIYPNPSRGGEFSIQANEPSYQITIFNTSGAVVLEPLTINGELFHLSLQQPPGVYFLHISNTAGVIIKKLIIN